MRNPLEIFKRKRGSGKRVETWTVRVQRNIWGELERCRRSGMIELNVED